MMIIISLLRRPSLSITNRSFRKQYFHSLSAPTAGVHKDENVAIAEEKLRIPKRFVPFPFHYHEELELKVETLTNLGVGIGRVEISEFPSPNVDDSGNEHSNSHCLEASKTKRRLKNEEKEKRKLDIIDDNARKGWVVMVPNVVPGELVRVRIYRNHKSYSEADLVDIIAASPYRITPKCPLFEECGGCQYQHIPIHLQRQYKQQQVQQLLNRSIRREDIKIPSVLPTIGTDEEYYYRSKITPHYNGLAAGSTSIGPIGFNKKNASQRSILDVEHCIIATKPINEKLVLLRQLLQEQALNGTLKRPFRGATLLLRHHGEDEVTTDPSQLVSTTVNNLKFTFVAGNFFQNNPFLLPLMVQRVVDGAAFSENGQRMTHLIDCYCGSGLFCLSASHLFETCVGIEVNEKAIEEARYNGKLNKIENCSFVAASAEAIFESNDLIPCRNTNDCAEKKSFRVRDFPRETTCIVLDPPRKGCSTEFLEQLYRFEPQRVVYMSCDPATQARDANGLVTNGFDIVSVQPFDLFPQTRHVESLIIFERKSFINKTNNQTQ